MDYIKNSFERVKEDIFLLREEINLLKINFFETRDQLNDITEILNELLQKQQLDSSTHQQQILMNTTDTSTQKISFNPLKHQNTHISIGNEGVSTDRQTDRQTDKKAEIATNSIEEAAKILESLDNLKKEIRLKFKRLTNQEILVFSMIYQLEEEIGQSNYKILSQRLHLTESSIRDYVGRLIKKGIPVDKIKINNKSIQLKISDNLKKIATLSTILQLRDL